MSCRLRLAGIGRYRLRQFPERRPSGESVVGIVVHQQFPHAFVLGFQQAAFLHEPFQFLCEVDLLGCRSLYFERFATDVVTAEELGRKVVHRRHGDLRVEFVATDYRRLLQQKKVREKDFDWANFLNVLEPFYRGGEYDYLLNSNRQMDLLHKRFIVFELDNISENRTLLPVVTIIIMETFLAKMRRLQGVRKVLLLEEAWKAIAKEGMASYVKYLCAPVQAA